MGGQQNKIGGQRARISGHNLMQNCDLPPPSKVFMGPDKSFILSMNRVFNIAGKEAEQDRKNYDTYGIIENGDENRDKMELLKALQASQTRAREAEKKAAVLKKERDGLSIALLEEAMQLFAYRQQVRLLELQVVNLQSLWLQQKQVMSGCWERSPEGALGSSKEDHEETSVVWILALVFSLGIGMTAALACRY